MKGWRGLSPVRFGIQLVIAIVLVAGAWIFVLGGSEHETGCERAVREASEVSSFADAPDDLDDAIGRCASVTELRRAMAIYADDLAVAPEDAGTWSRTRCQAEAYLQPEPICVSLGF